MLALFGCSNHSSIDCVGAFGALTVRRTSSTGSAILGLEIPHLVDRRNDWRCSLPSFLQDGCYRHINALAVMEMWFVLQ
ncbi:hypothetical protein T08_14316 [Trichinella sp. T8]|nr:hypothetical protein T08_14316 [Trichinella sp. T8]